jgi:hypothetical protein
MQKEKYSRKLHRVDLSAGKRAADWSSGNHRRSLHQQGGEILTKMKQITPTFSLLILLMIALAVGQTVSAEPVAPLLKMTGEGLKMIKSQGKTLEDVAEAIPTKASVSLPVYPGAYFASSVENVHQEGSARKLSAVSIVSTAPPEKIKAWYRENLIGWTYDDMFDLFHEGRGKVDMGNLMGMQTITVTAEDDPGFDLMFYKAQGIKSRIVIRYEPKR